MSRLFTSIACSSNCYGVAVGCTLFINGDGNVYSFGKNTFGAHGFEEDYVFSPKMISTLKNIVSVHAYLIQYV